MVLFNASADQVTEPSSSTTDTTTRLSPHTPSTPSLDMLLVVSVGSPFHGSALLQWESLR